MAETTDPAKNAPPPAPISAKKEPSAVQPAPAEPKDRIAIERERVVIRPYPKAVFLYPVAATSVVCGFLTLTGVSPHALGFAFMMVFFFNLVVLAFEFTRHVSVAVVLSAFVIVLLGMLLNDRLHVVDFLGRVYASLDFTANAGFYFAIAVVYGLVLAGIIVDTRMDYWEVRGNEILHHHGFLGDVERYPAPSLKMKKEITDVFEYLLLLSGRLVLYPSGSERAIVLDNVPRINRAEARIEEMLDSMRVTIEGSVPQGR